jgi:hypothetical protein
MDCERVGDLYVPGAVLVVTSVSTVFFKSTMPSKFGGCSAPSVKYILLLELAIDLGVW